MTPGITGPPSSSVLSAVTFGVTPAIAATACLIGCRNGVAGVADDTNLLGPIWSGGCLFAAGTEVEFQGPRNNGPKLSVKVLELKRPSLIEHDAVGLDDGLNGRNVSGNAEKRGAWGSTNGPIPRSEVGALHVRLYNEFQIVGEPLDLASG